MNQEEQYYHLMRDDEADYRHQQLIEEWQYADQERRKLAHDTAYFNHFKTSLYDHIRETNGTERTSSDNEDFGLGNW